MRAWSPGSMDAEVPRTLYHTLVETSNTRNSYSTRNHLPNFKRQYRKPSTAVPGRAMNTTGNRPRVHPGESFVEDGSTGSSTLIPSSQESCQDSSENLIEIVHVTDCLLVAKEEEPEQDELDNWDKILTRINNNLTPEKFNLKY